MAASVLECRVYRGELRHEVRELGSSQVMMSGSQGRGEAIGRQEGVFPIKLGTSTMENILGVMGVREEVRGAVRRLLQKRDRLVRNGLIWNIQGQNMGTSWCG
jgi:hypothetical protein